MTIPTAVRQDLKRRLWAAADLAGWSGLAATKKAAYYEMWTRDPDIGGVVSRYMDARRIRVYLKDTLLKDYSRTRLEDHVAPLSALGISPDDVKPAEKFIKPHGWRLADGRVVCWAQAEDWRDVLMALHERSFGHAGATPFGAVLMGATGRFDQPSVRRMVGSAAERLGIERLVWLDSPQAVQHAGHERE